MMNQMIIKAWYSYTTWKISKTAGISKVLGKKYIIIPLTFMNHMNDRNIPTQHGLIACPHMWQGQITEELHRNKPAHPWDYICVEWVFRQKIVLIL